MPKITSISLLFSDKITLKLIYTYIGIMLNSN